MLNAPLHPAHPLISGMLADRIFGWLARGAAVLTLFVADWHSCLVGAWGPGHQIENMV